MGYRFLQVMKLVSSFNTTIFTLQIFVFGTFEVLMLVFNFQTLIFKNHYLLYTDEYYFDDSKIYTWVAKLPNNQVASIIYT